MKKKLSKARVLFESGEIIVADHFDETVLFRIKRDDSKAARILFSVFEALRERGYDPVSQLVGYLLSGDPTYITNHRDARSTIRSVSRDELIEELVKSYVRGLTTSEE